MGARDVLAEAVWRAVWSSHSPWSEADDAERADVHEEADALLAAIRAMSPQQRAELIGGEVARLATMKRHDEQYPFCVPRSCPHSESVQHNERVIGPWREVRDV